MAMKDYDFFKTEEKLINSIYAYEAVIKLKERLIDLLENRQGAEIEKIRKRYAKEIQKSNDLLSSTNDELSALEQAQFGGEEEKKDPLPEYIMQMSDSTIGDIDNFNKHNETLIKIRVQIKELEKETAKIKKGASEQSKELEIFVKQLETLKEGLVEDLAELERLIQELDTKVLRGVADLIDAIDRFQKGYGTPKQMQ